ncbi:thioredoxin family protein (plasmid) [Acaryochloris sp. 'Moss Beach']|uniref:thioredoxin family protein n=1 Tax=Acaryochloris TaxID=155977 RepID=UPI001BB0C943|nr:MULTISPECIES: thioredoxin family protein [Acaryochloris]QUY45995.1 thioredoxin family protein [Acaryochloris marina S15]UJB72659.1 thioredoxin family protein [Acaryochloris sp. 'Moss Beach']
MGKIKVEILGKGCKKCKQLEANAQEALAALRLDGDFSHITDTMEIINHGVMQTPALVIGGKVLSQGKVIEPDKIQALIQVA